MTTWKHQEQQRSEDIRAAALSLLAHAGLLLGLLLIRQVAPDLWNATVITPPAASVTLPGAAGGSGENNTVRHPKDAPLEIVALAPAAQSERSAGAPAAAGGGGQPAGGAAPDELPGAAPESAANPAASARQLQDLPRLENFGSGAGGEPGTPEAAAGSPTPTGRPATAESPAPATPPPVMTPPATGQPATPPAAPAPTPEAPVVVARPTPAETATAQDRQALATQVPANQ
ncbi:MAG: hypothetical protein Q4C67_09310, partial [Deinococcus sp.]|nr:hypothetical protein [Deinococcus sp.]